METETQLMGDCEIGSTQRRLVFIAENATIAGVDEAGRGPLAGPVVAAAVVLDEARPIEGLKDSKCLTALQRKRLARCIRQRSRAFAVALAAPEEIDGLNILQAALLAMERAVLALAVEPDVVRIDGRQIPRFTGCQPSFVVEPVIGGDRLVAAISAASILAKVYRDRLMQGWHRRFPAYGFDRNKGYPTPSHLKVLRKLGPCPIHRESFAPVRAALEARA